MLVIRISQQTPLPEPVHSAWHSPGITLVIQTAIFGNLEMAQPTAPVLIPHTHTAMRVADNLQLYTQLIIPMELMVEMQRQVPKDQQAHQPILISLPYIHQHQFHRLQLAQQI